MANFSIGTAAFAGFRLIRDKPLTIVTWAVAFVAFWAAFVGLVLLLAGAALFPLIRNPQALENDPRLLFNAIPGLVGVGLVFMVLSILAVGVVYGAAYRAFLRPEQRSLGYFRFGGDELRLLGAYLLLVVLYVGVSIVPNVLIAIMRTTGGAGAELLATLLGLAFLVLVLWGAVRLSLVMPATFVSRRLGIGESWRLTKGRFWKLLAAYLVAGLVMFGAYLAVILLFVTIGAGAFTGLASMADPGQAIGAMLPFLLLLALIYPLIGACALAVMIGPTASIYSQLTEDAGRTAETFA